MIDAESGWRYFIMPVKRIWKSSCRVLLTPKGALRLARDFRSDRILIEARRLGTALGHSPPQSLTERHTY